MAIDPVTGVYIYDGGEPDYPMVDTLNLLAESTRDAIASVRSGEFLMESINPVNFVSINGGWNWRPGFVNVVRRLGDRYEFTLAFTKSTAYGHAESPATINAAFAPVGASEWPLTGIQSGGTTSAAGIGAVVSATRQILPFSPTTGRTNLQVSGYFVTV